MPHFTLIKRTSCLTTTQGCQIEEQVGNKAFFSLCCSWLECDKLGCFVLFQIHYCCFGSCVMACYLCFTVAQIRNKKISLTTSKTLTLSPQNCNSVQAIIVFFSWSIFTGINIMTSSQRSGHEIHLINTITSFLSRCWCKHTSLTCYKYCWASWIVSKLTDGKVVSENRKEKKMEKHHQEKRDLCYSTTEAADAPWETFFLRLLTLYWALCWHSNHSPNSRSCGCWI